MTDTEATILLDRKTRAIRSGNRWAIQKLLPSGEWDALATWSGGRRSLYHWLEQNDVHPTRDAEEALNLLPESQGFRERG